MARATGEAALPTPSSSRVVGSAAAGGSALPLDGPRPPTPHPAVAGLAVLAADSFRRRLNAVLWHPAAHSVAAVAVHGDQGALLLVPKRPVSFFLGGGATG